MKLYCLSLPVIPLVTVVVQVLLGCMDLVSATRASSSIDIRGNTTGVLGSTWSVEACSSYLSPLDQDEYLACLKDLGYYSSPFWFNRDVAATSEFQFISSPGVVVNDDGSFCGKYVGASVQDALEYFDFDDDNVFNTNGINGISYYYYINNTSTNGCAATPKGCAKKKISLYVYLRSSTNSTAKYDCRYKYTPPRGQLLEAWNPVNVDLETNPSKVKVGRDSSISACPANVQSALGQGYVLGTYGTDRNFANGKPGKLIFGLSVKGDTEVCFDVVEVKYADQTVKTYVMTNRQT